MTHDADLVCKWFCRFVLETRKTDGTRYPPATLRSLVSRELNKAPFSVLDKSDARFRDLLHTVDTLTCNLHKEGLGAVKIVAKLFQGNMKI